MDQIWELLKSFMGLPSLPSPREDLLNFVLKGMLQPQSADLVTQNYFDKLSFFAFLASVLVVVQFATSSVQGILHGDMGPRMRDWVYTSMFLYIGVPLAPALIVVTQAFFNLLGKEVFLLMLGTSNIKDGVAVLGGLTGNPAVDLVLSISQIGFLIVLASELQLVIIAMYASVIALMIGVSLKFLGDFGDQVFKSSVNVTVFGVAGNAIVLGVMGIVVGFGRVVSRGNTLSSGLINTGAIFVSLICLNQVLKHIGGQLKATAASAVSGAGNMKNRLTGGNSGYESDGGDKQVDDSAKTHRRHAARNTSDQQYEETESTSTNGDDQSSPITDERSEAKDKPKRRHSSMLARSQSNNSPESTDGSNVDENVPRNRQTDPDVISDSPKESSDDTPGDTSTRKIDDRNSSSERGEESSSVGTHQWTPESNGTSDTTSETYSPPASTRTSDNRGSSTPSDKSSNDDTRRSA